METEVVWSIIALLGGCALRTLLPYQTSTRARGQTMSVGLML